MTCCVTLGQSLALSGPYSLHCKFLSPLWTFGQNVTEHVWHQYVFALEEAAFEPGFEESGVSIEGDGGTVFQAKVQNQECAFGSSV